MGRARGGPAASSGDRFTAVFGTRRGPMEVDTLLTKFPTPSARAELKRFVLTPGFAEIDEGLTLLHQHRYLIEERPLLADLAQFLPRVGARHVVASQHPSTRHLVALAGLRNEYSDQLFSDGTQHVHLCAAGADYRLDPELTTACAVPLSRSDIGRMPRGTWRRLATQQMIGRCEICEAESADLADCQETDLYPALDPAQEETLTEQLGNVVRAEMDAQLARGERPEEEALRDVAKRAHSEERLRFLANSVYAGTPAVVARALGKHKWKIVHDAVGSAALAPSELWDADEWHAWLQPYSLNSTRTRTDEVLRAERVAATEHLFSDICADLGIKKPRR